MDWLLRRRTAPEAPPAEPELQPIALYGEQGQVSGWTDPAGERVTDILQRGDELMILPDGANRANPEDWKAVDTDALLLVVPPPHTSAPELRLQRQRQAVRIRVGPYVVHGTAHLRPGQAEDPYLRATQPYLPLTEAIIEQAGQPEQRVPVVIVNFRRIDEFREI